MKQSCYFYKEKVEDDNSIATSCKLLLVPFCLDNKHCKFAKTYAEYNPKQVEKQIAEYGRTHK